MHRRLRQFVQSKEFHHDRHLCDATTRDVAQTRSLNAVAADGGTVFRNDDQHHFALALLQVCNKDVKRINEGAGTRLKLFPTGLARLAVTVV